MQQFHHRAQRDGIQGIRQLVSTFELHGNRGRGVGTLQTNSNSKCQDLAKFSFSGGGGALSGS